MNILEKKEEKKLLIPVESIVDEEGEKIEDLAELFSYEDIYEFAPLKNIDNIDPNDFYWHDFGVWDEVGEKDTYWTTYTYYGGIKYKNKYYGVFCYDKANDTVRDDSFVNPDIINIDGIDYYEFKEVEKKEKITVTMEWDFA